MESASPFNGNADSGVRCADRSLRETLLARPPVSPERVTPRKSRGTQNPARMESPFTGLTIRQSLAWYFLGRKPVPMRTRTVTLQVMRPRLRPMSEDCSCSRGTGARSHEEAGYSIRA